MYSIVNLVIVLYLSNINRISQKISDNRFREIFAELTFYISIFQDLVVIIGYPAYAQHGPATQITTNGIISGFGPSAASLPNPNYFVSAKIDSGNSGGIALSKDENGICVLGISTWLTVGNYETQGIVQNIHNIFYSSR